MSWALSEVVIENVGGIVGRKVYNFRPGVNYIEGPNDSNKTSLVRGVVWGLTGAYGLAGRYEIKAGEEAEIGILLNKYKNRGYVQLLIKKNEKESLRIKREIIKEGRKAILGSCSVVKITPKGEQCLAENDFEKIKLVIEKELGIIGLNRSYYTIFNNEHDALLVNLIAGAKLRNYITSSSGALAYDRAHPHIGKLQRNFKDKYTKSLEEVRKKEKAIGELEALQKRLNARTSELKEKKKKGKELTSAIDNLSKRVKELDKISEEIEKLQRDLGSKKERQEEITGEIDETKKRIQSGERKIEQWKEELVEKREHLRGLEEERRRVEEELEKTRVTISEIEDRLRIPKEKIDELETARGVYKEIAVIESMAEEISTSKSQLKAINDDIKEKTEALRVKGGLLKTFEYIARWVEESVKACPICDRAWSMELQTNSFKKLEPKRVEIEKEVSKLSPEIEKLETRRKELEEKIEYYEKRKTEVEIKKRVHAESLLRLGVKVPRTLEELGKSILNLRNEIKRDEEELKKLREKEEECKAKMEIALKPQIIERLKSRVTDLRVNIESEESSIKRETERLKQLGESKKKFLSDITHLGAEVSKLERVYDKIKHSEMKRKLRSLESEGFELRGGIETIKAELERGGRRLSELKEMVKGYEEYERKAELYKNAIAIAKIAWDVVKEVAEDLKEKVRLKISESMLKTINRLDFKGYEDVSLNEKYVLVVKKGARLFEPETLNEGVRNALGISVKLAIASYTNNIPAIVCYDGCLHLDPERKRKLIEYLRDFGTNSILITRRTPTEPMRVSHAEL